MIFMAAFTENWPVRALTLHLHKVAALPIGSITPTKLCGSAARHISA